MCIENQEDLDTAIKLVDQNERLHSLRLMLVNVNSFRSSPAKTGAIFQDSVCFFSNKLLTVLNPIKTINSGDSSATKWSATLSKCF